MQIIWRSICLVLVLSGLAGAVDQIHIVATLDDSTHSITGVTEVIWLQPDSSWAELHFRLWANRPCASQKDNGISGDCGTTIDSVIVNGARIVDSLEIDRTDLRVPVLPIPGDSLTAQVYFRTALPRTFDRLAYVGGTYYLDGWFPMPAPIRDGRWLVVNYDGEAELVGDFYDFTVRFTSPADFQQIAAGRISSDTADSQITAVYELKPAHDFAMLLGREFKLKEYDIGSTTVRVYHQEPVEDRVDSLASSIRATFEYMAAHVRPYPFDELVVVAGIPFQGGIEFPRMFWQSPPENSDRTKFDRMIAIHETIHQWFYGIIASNQAETPWMDEAITEYLTERVAEFEAGEKPSLINGLGLTAEIATYNRLQGYTVFDRLPITRSSIGYTRNEYFGAIYGKGALVMRTFGNLLGAEEDAFWGRYYDLFAFKHPSERDFVELANQFKPFKYWQNVAELLDWNRRLDLRVLDIVSNRQEDSGDFKSDIKLRLTNPLPFPVQLRYHTTDGSVHDTIIVAQMGYQAITVRTAMPLLAAEVDPDRQYALDINYLNNSFSTETNGAAFRLFSGMTFLVQSLFSLAWGW